MGFLNKTCTYLKNSLVSYFCNVHTLYLYSSIINLLMSLYLFVLLYHAFRNLQDFNMLVISEPHHTYNKGNMGNSVHWKPPSHDESITPTPRFDTQWVFKKHLLTLNELTQQIWIEPPVAVHFSSQSTFYKENDKFTKKSHCPWIYKF